MTISMRPPFSFTQYSDAGLEMAAAFFCGSVDEQDESAKHPRIPVAVSSALLFMRITLVVATAV